MKKISLGIITHPSIDFDVTVNVGIRYDAVEDIVDEFDPVAPDFKKWTSTMGCEFGNLSGVGQKRWTIANEGNIHRAVLGIVQDVKTIGLPYFERFSDPRNALEALAGDEKENWLHMPLHGRRWMSAIALAHILQDVNRFQDLVVVGRNSLEKRSDQKLQAFNALASKLSPLP